MSGLVARIICDGPQAVATEATALFHLLAAGLVLIRNVTMLVAIFRSIPITVLVAAVTTILLPFHLPLSVLEFHDGHPAFIVARRCLQVR
jgi:hypothetical protein